MLKVSILTNIMCSMNLKLQINHMGVVILLALHSVILPALHPEILVHQPIHLYENRHHFKQVFNLNKGKGDSLDYIFETVRCEIQQLTGKKKL